MAGGFAPTLPVGAPPLPNLGCATEKAYKVLPPPKFWAGYATEYWKWVISLYQIANHYSKRKAALLLFPQIQTNKLKQT